MEQDVLLKEQVNKTILELNRVNKTLEVLEIKVPPLAHEVGSATERMIFIDKKVNTRNVRLINYG